MHSARPLTLTIDGRVPANILRRRVLFSRAFDSTLRPRFGARRVRCGEEVLVERERDAAGVPIQLRRRTCTRSQRYLGSETYVRAPCTGPRTQLKGVRDRVGLKFSTFVCISKRGTATYGHHICNKQSSTTA